MNPIYTDKYGMHMHMWKIKSPIFYCIYIIVHSNIPVHTMQG